MLNHKNSQTVRATSGSLAVPAELKPFSEPSFLLPGESFHDFEAIRQMRVDDIRPEIHTEWLWTLGSRQTLLGNPALPAPKEEGSGRPSHSRDRSDPDGEGMPVAVVKRVWTEARLTQ